MGKKLVIGASGFLGSHVTRRLAERGDDVRVLIRHTSSTRGIDGLPVERHYGDRLMHIMSPMNHSKAERELGWRPAPTTEALAEAAEFFVGNRRQPAEDRR